MVPASLKFAACYAEDAILGLEELKHTVSPSFSPQVALQAWQDALRDTDRT